MGFDVTAANVIFFIAALTAGSVAMGAYWKDADHLEEARRIEGERIDERAHTNLSIESAQYNIGVGRFTVEIKNNGPTVIDISDLAYVLDGALVAPATLASVTVQGAATATDLLLPLETLEVVMEPISASPEFFQVVTRTGAKANWGAP